MPLTKTGPGFGLIDKAIQALTKNQVLIGIPAGSARQDGGPDNASLGYIFETGAPERNIPATPHLVPGVESIRERAVAIYRKAGRAVLTGDFQAIEAAHQSVGLIAQAAVQQKVTDGPWPALAERTLQERRRRGRTGEKRLLDTGQYRRSITYVVRRKGSR